MPVIPALAGQRQEDWYIERLRFKKVRCVWRQAGNIAEWLDFVIPGNNLDMVVAEADISPSVEGRGICISVKAAGDDDFLQAGRVRSDSQ